MRTSSFYVFPFQFSQIFELNIGQTKEDLQKRFGSDALIGLFPTTSSPLVGSVHIS